MIELVEINIRPKDGQILRGRENCYSCNKVLSNYWRVKTQREDNPPVTRVVLCLECLNELREQLNLALITTLNAQ